MYQIEKSYLSGKVQIPSSKSHTIRALLCASLAKGKTTLIGNFEGNDIQETIDALRELGIQIKQTKKKIKINSIKGFTNKTPHFTISASATTFRMVLPVVALNCNQYTFTLGTQLASRPHGDICNFLNSNGAQIEIVGNVYKGIQIKKLTNKTYQFGISSQGFSGVLIAFAFEGVHLDGIKGEIVSKSYIDITKEVLQEFGFKVSEDFRIEGQRKDKVKYSAPTDYSTLSNYIALNAIGNNIKYKEVDGNHPDKEFRKYVAEQSGVIDLSESVDLIFPMIYLSINFKEKIEIVGISRTRHKESNRIEESKKILDQLCIKYEETNDGLTIYPNNEWKESPVVFTSSNDHRCDMIKVMICTQTGGQINNLDSIKKSHPSFIKNLIHLGCTIREV